MTGVAASPGDVSEFEVDLEEVLHVVERMVRCEEALRAVATRLAGRVDALHATWDGLAAAAHHEAQAEWARGFVAMRAGLEQIRDAVRVAHDHYDGAARTNERMWRQLG
jgi:WXG100 family type VII secretion target